MARSSTGGPSIRDRSGVKLKGLKRYSVNGSNYVYHRASGTKLPSDIPEDHPRFLEAYLKAENGANQLLYWKRSSPTVSRMSVVVFCPHASFAV